MLTDENWNEIVALIARLSFIPVMTVLCSAAFVIMMSRLLRLSVAVTRMSLFVVLGVGMYCLLFSATLGDATVAAAPATFGMLIFWSLRLMLRCQRSARRRWYAESGSPSTAPDRPFS